MKVKAVLLVAFAFVAMSVNGQELKFGLKGGLNFSNFGGDDNDNVNKTKIGFHVGGFAQYGLTENLALQPELLLSFEGSKADNDDKTPFSNTYLNIPVMLNYKLGAVQGLYFEGGLQLGFLLGAKIDGESEFDTGFGTFKVKDSYKSTNFSLNLGAGYAITENISAGLRYSMGLSSIADDSDANLKQNNFQLSLAYKF